MSIIDESWDYAVHFDEAECKLFCEFESNVSSLSKQISHQLKEFENHDFDYTSNENQNSDEKLKTVADKNKQLASDLKIKLYESERQQVNFDKLKSDHCLLTQEIKDTHEAYLMAKKYYRRVLKIYFNIESNSDGKKGIFLQFFTDVKKESKNYSVNLLKDLKSKNYEILKIIPGQTFGKEVHKKLLTTNDIPGAICYIRQEFINMKQSKISKK